MLIEVLLIAVNVVLWIILFLTLKKKLSPNGIIKDARKELEGILRQINGATDRDIRLIQVQLDRLREATSSAELLCKKIEERISMLYGEMAKVSAVKTAEESLYHEKSLDVAVESKAVSSESDSSHLAEPIAESVNTSPHDDTLNKSRSPLESYIKERNRFSSDPVSASVESSQKLEIPEFIKAEKPIEVKKPFRQQVREMLALGYSIEEIAHATGRSTQEVKITIEIS